MPVAALGSHMIPPVIFDDADGFPDFRRHCIKTPVTEVLRAINRRIQQRVEPAGNGCKNGRAYPRTKP